MRHHLLLVLAALAALVMPATADVDYGWIDHTTFDFDVTHMPDFDQKRSGHFLEGGLPGGGRYHCIPTAILNLFAYAANHGFPELEPGDHTWYFQEQYLPASLWIDTLADMMDTDPDSGTGTSDAVEGAKDWLDEYGRGRFVFEHASRTGSWAPKINDLAERMAMNGIVAFMYGRYNVISSTEDIVLIGERTSGHCVTLVRAFRFNDVMNIESRDPSNNGNAYTQSSWKRKAYDTKNLLAFSLSSGLSKTMTSLDYDPDGDQVRLIDTMFSIRPKASYTWASDNRITVNVPWTLDVSFPHVRELLIDLPAGSFIVDSSELIGAGQVGLVSELTGATLGVASLADGSFTSIAPVPNGSRVVAGRHGPLYALCGEYIECYDPELPTPLVASLELEHFASDIAYDDSTDTVVIWSSEASILALATPSLDAITYHTLQQNLPQATDGHVQVDRHGTIWFTAGPPNSRIYHVDLSSSNSVGAISHPDLVGMTDFDIDDDGRVFACVGGIVNEFMQNPDTGGWMPATDSPSGLDGTPCDGQISVTRSRSNFDPATMSGPGWVNLDADLVDAGVVIADCPGDIDGDQNVGFTDLTLLLSAWGPCPACDADEDGNGFIGFEDLTALLSNWGPCSDA